MTDELMNHPAMDIPAATHGRRRRRGRRCHRSSRPPPPEADAVPRRVPHQPASPASVIGAGALYAFDRQYTGRVLPGVSVGGDRRLDGLTRRGGRRAARGGLRQVRRGHRSSSPAAGSRWRSTTPTIDRRPDIDRMVAEAMAVGRAGNAVERVDPGRADRGPRSRPRAARPVRRRRASPATSRRYRRATRRSSPKDATVVGRRTTASSSIDGVEGRVADTARPDGLPDAGARRCRRAVGDPGRTSTCRRSSPMSRPTRRDRRSRLRRTIATDIAIVEGKESWTIPATTVPIMDLVRGRRRRDVRSGGRSERASTAALAAVAKSVDKKRDERVVQVLGQQDHRRRGRQERPGARHRDHRGPRRRRCSRRAPPAAPTAMSRRQ